MLHHVRQWVVLGEVFIQEVGLAGATDDLKKGTTDATKGNFMGSI